MDLRALLEGSNQRMTKRSPEDDMPRISLKTGFAKR
jgi:hypothetical protein